jgi:cytochrome P450
MQIKVADLAQPEFKANPYPFYARMRSEQPIYRTTFLGKTTWLVSRYADVSALFKDERFVKDWWPTTKCLHRFAGAMTHHMLNKDGPEHLRLRGLVHRAFAPQLMEKLRQRIQTRCDELLDRLEGKTPSDLMSGYALPLPLDVISELLGIPATERQRMHNLSRSSLSAVTFFSLVRSLPDQRLLMRSIRKLIAERRVDPREDLITALVQAEEAGDKLTEAELVGTISLLLIAGYETTVNLIGNGAFTLLQNPEALDTFRKNPELTAPTIEEVLRFTSPLDVASQRFAAEDLEIDSTRIGRGQIVIAILGAANHDENQFPAPEQFDIRREPNKHLSFGQGAHFCIGAPLARLEGKIALTTLFQRFPNIRLRGPAASLRWRKSLIVRGLEELPVILK